MKKINLILVVATVWAWPFLAGQAQGNATSTAPRGFLDNISCLTAGDCQLNDIVLAITALINWMLGVVGALALLYFFWGGVIWLTSDGHPEKVKKGASIMINTIYALGIVFASYIFLQFLINDVLRVDESYRVQSGNTENISPPAQPNQ
ncbi:MAG: pilin [Patescibacteria group bacterium]|nr:pilin [Patescibacteria group bacterium]